jgi:uncharacterized damage-inducible protein DinB
MSEFSSIPSIAMNIQKQLALHIRQVFNGGNWTDSNLSDVLQDIGWEEAVKPRTPMHSIAELLYHIQYYFVAIVGRLEGGPLDAKDRFSFDLPPINGERDWETLRNKAFEMAERLAAIVEALPDERLHGNFDEEKYGSVLRNILGVIEHTHYHLGQIVLLRKRPSA